VPRAPPQQDVVGGQSVEETFGVALQLRLLGFYSYQVIEAYRVDMPYRSQVLLARPPYCGAGGVPIDIHGPFIHSITQCLGSSPARDGFFIS